MDGVHNQRFPRPVPPSSSFSSAIIFDPRAYHSAFQKLTSAISIQNLTYKSSKVTINNTVLPPYKIPKHSQYDPSTKEKQSKKELVPHLKKQPRNLYSILKQKIEINQKNSKKRLQFEGEAQKQVSEIVFYPKEKKKSSISAYFHARKQLFDKERIINLSNESAGGSYKQTTSLNPIHQHSHYHLHHATQQISDQSKYLKVINSSRNRDGSKNQSESNENEKNNFNYYRSLEKNHSQNLGVTQSQTQNVDSNSNFKVDQVKQLQEPLDQKRIRYSKIMDENKKHLEQMFRKSKEKLFAHRSANKSTYQAEGRQDELSKLPFLIPHSSKRASIIKKKFQQSLLMVQNRAPSKRSSEKYPDRPPYYANFEHQTSLDQEDLCFGDQFDKINVNAHEASPTEKMAIESCTSARAFAVVLANQHHYTLVHSKNHNTRLEIASMTKIMTCLLALRLARKFCIDIFKEKVITSERASKMTGTSARLAYADTCTLYELMHGLMLPSGNDAAIAIGEWGGKTIKRFAASLRRQRGEIEQVKPERSMNFLSTYGAKRKTNLKLFIHHMNKLAKHLSLNNTNFVNVHGLMNEKAYCTALDVAKLSIVAMKNDIFRGIVNKKEFKCDIFNRTYSQTKQISWINTNKLLELQGFEGVKTGVTPNAGPCLSSFFKMRENEFIMIAVLKTKSMEKRFKQTLKLVEETLKISQRMHSNNAPLYKKWLGKLLKSEKIELPANESEECNNFQEDESEMQELENGDPFEQGQIEQQLIFPSINADLIQSLLMNK